MQTDMQLPLREPLRALRSPSLHGCQRLSMAACPGHGLWTWKAYTMPQGSLVQESQSSLSLASST